MRSEGTVLGCWAAVAVTTTFGATAHAQCQVRSVVLTGEGSIAADEGFGFAVDLEGDLAAVGSSAGESAEGRVAIFRNVGGAGGWEWVPEARIQPGDPADRRGFARAVEVIDGVVIVGGPHPSESGERGSVFIYEFDGIAWVEASRLSPNAGEGFSDGFGTALHAEGDLLFVGAPFDLEAGEPAGAAYIYRRGGGGAWALEARLTSPTAQAHVRFGAGGALVMDGVLVGEPLESQGVVHVFSEDGGAWTWRQNFRNNSGRGLGGVVAGQSDAAFATRFWPPPYLESVDAYKPDAGWIWDRRRIDSTGACEGVTYGAAIDVHGDVAVVGAPTDPEAATPHAGFAQLYRERPEWNRRERFESPVGAVEADRYGHAVAVNGDRLLVGAPGDVPGPGLVGLAHLTEISAASPAVLDDPPRWNTLSRETAWCSRSRPSARSRSYTNGSSARIGRPRHVRTRMRPRVRSTAGRGRRSCASRRIGI